ncbi:MAG: type II/IV secretion system protein [Candidatus Omnitrophota bacterium]
MTILIDTLIKENLITEEQLRDAKDKQLGAKRPIQELLLEMNFINEEDLIKVTSRVFKMPVTDLEKEEIDSSAVKLMPYETAKCYGVFPVRTEGNTLILAMSNPQDVVALDVIKILVNMEVKPILTTKNLISLTIEKYYRLDKTLYDLFKNIKEDIKIEEIRQDKKGPLGFSNEEFGDAQESAIVRLVNLILGDAVREKASDIHIEPQEDSVALRYRLDGDLRKIMLIPKKMHSHLVSRIKILAELDISETRKPQDGRIRIAVDERDIDLRISTIPTFYGEKIVLRLLDPKAAKIELDKLGFTESELNIFQEAINKPQGMILVTGPTGSGKTSTVYAALNYIRNQPKNIVTIEDPIEYLIDGVNQIQVNLIKDVTFANGLRSILRQDPNVILVGEIRDKETAEIAFRSSLTGHLVFTTLHANNSVYTITRLLDIGLEPYLISSSIILIIAQRLLKVICPYCKEQNLPEKGLLEKFNVYLDKYRSATFYKGKGCEKCKYSGYSGRTAIFEILKNNEKIRSLISDRVSEDIIFKEAKNFGLKSLAESGIEKTLAGITTLEEVARIADTVDAEIRQEKPDTQGRIRILIADDDKLIRKMVIEAFDKEKDKFEFTEAKNGQEALRYIHNTKPDLLISDVLMPEMNGYELTKALRARLESASIPIIMLTSQSDKESEIRGLDAGADDYITKPFDKDKILARANMLLRRVK